MRFSSVSLKGNILTFDTLEAIAGGSAKKSSFRDYGYASRNELQTAITDAWADANGQYALFQNKLARLSEDEPATSETRKSWIEPLLLSLGYTLAYNRRHLEIDERRYAISHGEDSLNGFPVHVVGANQSLDKRAGGMRMSPHAMVQEYLNREDAQLYALVTNGRFLRLLRDSSQLTRLSYVEFDLTRIFEEELVSDFALLFRLLHRSRLPQEDEEGQDSILETYHLEGLASGSRIRDGLSNAVERGILHLGRGLLREPANEPLRQWVHATPDAETRYYDHLLKLIYRLLFLMVIEERNLIFPQDREGADAGASNAGNRKIYYNHYSLSRLRQLSLRPQLANARAYDLWENLLNTFRLFEPHGIGQRLGIEPLAGDLFRSEALGPLMECRIDNAVLLGTLNGLSEFDNEQGRKITVNYASLDVEEFGSVYEGLLEYRPVIRENPWSFEFAKGDDRGSSGSHYTPDELVQPLIKHSLDHLIADRTVAPDAPETERREAIRKLLSLTVCDVACGSGHILLAAARRIGLEVARLRSTEEQPNPGAVRRGTRDAIRHCIYGVDKNPLAVELCKVALWLEAHVPGEPLNFLDHRIKNGDAIVGLGRMEELQNGIATDAFKAYREEEKKNVSLLKKRNKKERKARGADAETRGKQTTTLFAELDPVSDRLERYRARFAKFSRMPERTVEEIEAKKEAYRRAIDNPDWYFIKGLADIQVAQFFVDKSELDQVMTDEQYFDFMGGRLKQSRAEAVARGASEERKFFHWFLEFPEVFSEGGFSCILGNPPYRGNRKLRGDFGGNYVRYVETYYIGAGVVDLVIYFIRRASIIIGELGFLSLITTNTVSQGNARTAGLSYLLDKGWKINFAEPNIPWPGVANLTISLLSCAKGKRIITPILNGYEVNRITSILDSYDYIGDPHELTDNSNVAYIGSVIGGSGFILSKEEADSISNPLNHHLIKPFTTGSDLYKSVNKTGSRAIIDLGELPLAEAEKFPHLIHLVRERVKPQRDKLNRKSYRENWWKFAERCTNLYKQIKSFETVLVKGRVSKTFAFCFANAKQVFADAVVVFATKESRIHCTLQSSLHEAWAWRYCTTMKYDMNYGPTKVFRNFPFPPLWNLENNCVDFYNIRNITQNELLFGLTDLYNQFHNPTLTTDYDTYFEDDALTLKPAELKKRGKETYNLHRHLEKTGGTIGIGEAVERIAELRNLHKQLDEAVLAAYGWHVDTRRWGPAIKLGHDFHEVDYLPEKDNVRYTISQKARREVLRRLLLLNHEIHEAEERGVPYDVIDAEKITALMREQVEAWCPHTERLHYRTLKFLCTGEDLLPNLERSLTKSYKPFVTQYASALENELLEKVFVAYNAAFQRRYPLEDDARATYLDAQATIDPQKLGNFTRKLKKEDMKYTLGEMQYILNLVYKPTGSTLGKSELLRDFRAFVRSVYGELLFDRALLQRLKDFTQTYRNEAAHTGEVGKELAEGCRDEVRGVIQLLVASESTRQDEDISLRDPLQNF